MRFNFVMWFWKDVDETAMLKLMQGKDYEKSLHKELVENINKALQEFTKLPPESHCGLLIYPQVFAAEALISSIKTRAFVAWEEEGQKGVLRLEDTEVDTIMAIKTNLFYTWSLILFG